MSRRHLTLTRGGKVMAKAKTKLNTQHRVMLFCAATCIDHAAVGILAHAMLWFDMAETRKPTEMNSKNMF